MINFKIFIQKNDFFLRITIMINRMTQNYEEIRIDQIPTQDKWVLTPLYKLNANGNTMEWRIEFDGDKYLRTIHGDIITSNGTSGAMTTSLIEVIPKSNRNMQEQALLEARSRYKDKFLSDGYRPAGEAPPNDCQPALANKWVPHTVMNKAKEEKKTKGIKVDATWKVIDRWPVAVSPKLDGIRMLAKFSNKNIRCRSRLNRLFANLQHIESELLNFFPYLPSEAELDGELYSHNMTFQQLTSATKTVKTRHPRLKEVEYHIFDIILGEEMSYDKRYELLMNAYNRYLEDGNKNTTFVFVPIEFANNDQDILNCHKKYVEQGYEGAIVRKIGSKNDKELKESCYHPGRSSNLLKYKEFIDEEAVVVEVDKATGTEEGAAMLLVRDKRNNIFPIRMRGSVDRRREWYQNPKLVLNKEVTIRYQELSDTGVPRFPVGIAVRDYE